MLLSAGDARNVEPLAGLLEHLDQLRIDHGVEHDAGACLDILQHPLELPPAAHQGMDMLDGADLRILHSHRLGDRDQRLAGRVRDHVQVESAGSIHGYALG